jgi:lysophospholipase L1-like esterase
MKRCLFSGVCLTLLLPFFFASAAESIYHSSLPPGANPAAFASARDDWYSSVQQKFDQFGGKHFDIIFDGDSITNRWEGTGRQIWAPRFEGHAAEFGIEGDRVENLLWRLSKGQVDGIDPKLVVLMIGTNNSGRDSAEQIAEGIKALVAEYKTRCPNAHILLMGIFPRGAKATDGGRLKVAAVNAKIASLADGTRVTFLDISKKMIEPDGSISPEMMPDSVHPTLRGYQIWADAMEPIIAKYVLGSSTTSTSEKPRGSVFTH